MSTNKNTFKYLCLVFGAALVQLILLASKAPVAIKFIAIFGLVILSIKFASKYTGISAPFTSNKSKIFLMLGGFILSLFAALADVLALFPYMLLGVALESISFSFSELAMPVSYFAALAVVIFSSLALCKLTISEAQLKFPRGAYMGLCFFPALLFLLFGIVNICLIYAFPEMMENVELGMPAFMYLFVFIKSISIGWSIFCMLKYNQSMKIKALLEMQAKLL